MKIGDRVTCRCAPGCASNWPKGHGPCAVGEVVGIGEGEYEGDVAVRHDHGEFVYYVDVGYGHRMRQSYAEESWISARSLRPAV